MDNPNAAISYTPAKEGEVLRLASGAQCRIQEDGSKTDNRMGCAEFTIPANTKGPPPHWHVMHDETFLVTQGSIRFHAKGGKHIDAKVGDVVVVPPQAPHTFENVTDGESKFFNVFTPAHYIHYFKLMDTWQKEGKTLNQEFVRQAMAYFATVGVQGEL